MLPALPAADSSEAGPAPAIGCVAESAEAGPDPAEGCVPADVGGEEVGEADSPPDTRSGACCPIRELAVEGPVPWPASAVKLK